MQKLLFPVHVDLPPSNTETLLSWAGWLKTAGFELEPFSARTVLVRTMPHMIRFKEDDMKEIAALIKLAICDKAFDEVKDRVAKLCEKYPLYK